MFLDQTEDHNINRQILNRYVQTLEDVKADVESKFRFYKLPKYEHSIFVSLPEDIEKVSRMGRIVNNSRANIPPLTIFNPLAFKILEYSEKAKSYREVHFTDDDALIARVPKHYKSVYLGHETESYLLAGGYDIASGASSNQCFLLIDGQIQELLEMYVAR